MLQTSLGVIEAVKKMGIAAVKAKKTAPSLTYPSAT
jgi:hypothetical protein